MRSAMAVYVTGLVLATGGVELTLAFLIRVGGALPSPTSLFWVAYLAAIVALFGAGAGLIRQGLGRLRSSRIPALPEWDGDERPT